MPVGTSEVKIDLKAILIRNIEYCSERSEKEKTSRINWRGKGEKQKRNL